MKRILTIVLMVAFVIGMAGCGSSTSTAPANSPSTKAKPTADFPKKPITMIIPYDAGGGSDLCNRKVSSIVEKMTGWNITCINMPGGSGATGYAELLTRDNDGYTLLGCTSTIVTFKLMGVLNVDYDDFDIVSGFNQEICTIGVNADWAKKNNINTLADFIKYSKANPGKVTVGSTAVGGIWNVDTVHAARVTGCDWNIVPSGGGGASAVVNCAGGAIEACSAGALEIYAQAQSGAIKMLAVMSDKRIETYPNVETFVENGYDVIGVTTRSILAPKGVDPKILAILEKAFVEAVKSEEYKQFCNSQGSVAWNTTGAEAREQYKREVDIYRKILK